jgi:hypothetical protein
MFKRTTGTLIGNVSRQRPYFINLQLRQRFHLLVVSLFSMIMAYSQTPVANRVKGVVKSLPKTSVVVAKYTDNQRHCLYYTDSNRLFCYDVISNRREETVFSNTSYNKILSTWLSPDGNFIFIAVDKGNLATSYMDAGQELWRYDSRNKRFIKVGVGFNIERKKGCIVIKRGTRCLNPSAPPDKQRWMAQNHFYDLYGKVIWAKDEYEVGK